MNSFYVSFKNTINKLLPTTLLNILKLTKLRLKYILFNFKYCKLQNNYKIIINKLKKKEKIRVAFFVIQCAVWKCDRIYKKFLEDNRFEPVIVIAPYILAGKEIMIRDMNQAYNYFNTKNYKVIKTYDEIKDAWLDVKNVINPDMVFFTNPYKGLTKDEYYIYNWLDTLTFYVSYFYSCGSRDEVFQNNPLQNLVWRYFCEYESKKEEIAKVAYSKARNVVYTGYPGLDDLLFYNNPITNKRKKIIWAPHHTIIGQPGCDLSNFLQYANFMLDISQKYPDLDFVFKPHPLLINKLYTHKDWGKEKADAYYAEWQNKPNTHVELGEYVDLFQSSDAMIHDCGSFINEYLAVNKPCMFCVKNKFAWDNLSEKTHEMFDKCYYLAYKKKDIIDFIENVVIKEHDHKKNSRTQYIKENLLPPNGLTASENIFNYIKDTITE